MKSCGIVLCEENQVCTATGYSICLFCTKTPHCIPPGRRGGWGYSPVLNTRDSKYNPPPSHSNLFTQLINLKQITEAFHNEFVAKFADSYVYIFL